MAESKTPEAAEMGRADEALAQSAWARAGNWLLRTFWGFLAGNALAILFFWSALAVTSGKSDTSGLLGVVIGIICYPFIVALVVVAWLAVAALVPVLQGQVVQAIASLVVCGAVAVAIFAIGLAATHRSVRAESKPGAQPKPAAEFAEDPLSPAKRAELEKREKDNAYGDYVPRR